MNTGEISLPLQKFWLFYDATMGVVYVVDGIYGATGRKSPFERTENVNY